MKRQDELYILYNIGSNMTKESCVMLSKNDMKSHIMGALFHATCKGSSV